MRKNKSNGSGPMPDDLYDGARALHVSAEGRAGTGPGDDPGDDDDEEDGGDLSPEELAVLSEAPVAPPPPERAAKMSADLAERARLKSQGQLKHNGEEISVVSTGSAWRAFLAGDPRGKVGDGPTPGDAVADLKRLLGGPGA